MADLYWLPITKFDYFKLKTPGVVFYPESGYTVLLGSLYTVALLFQLRVISDLNATRSRLNLTTEFYTILTNAIISLINNAVLIINTFRIRDNIRRLPPGSRLLATMAIYGQNIAWSQYDLMRWKVAISHIDPREEIKSYRANSSILLFVFTGFYLFYGGYSLSFSKLYLFLWLLSMIPSLFIVISTMNVERTLTYDCGLEYGSQKEVSNSKRGPYKRPYVSEGTFSCFLPPGSQNYMNYPLSKGYLKAKAPSTIASLENGTFDEIAKGLYYYPGERLRWSELKDDSLIGAYMSPFRNTNSESATSTGIGSPSSRIETKD